MIFQIFFVTICSLSKTIYGKQNGVEMLADLVSEDFIYDLAKDKPSFQANGNTIRPLNVNTFPVLANMGISYTLFELEPCGINLPHIHPRATELLYV